MIMITDLDYLRRYLADPEVIDSPIINVDEKNQIVVQKSEEEKE